MGGIKITSIETLIKLGKEHIDDEYAKELKELAKQPYNGVYDVLRDIVEQQMDNLLKGSA